MASEMVETACNFSNNGKYFIISGGDGKIKVWDTSTGVCKQEYTKNLHLTSPCSTLTWLQTSKPRSGSSPKKRKVDENQDLVAAGTTSGAILLYNVASNSLIAELIGHSDRVNCLSASSGRLFSCSDDKQIIEWELYEHKTRSKWKGGKERIKSILVLNCGKKLLSASCKIKLWDLDSKSVLKTFMGHSTDVFSLIEVPDRLGYFVSAAKADRTINVWSLAESNEENSGPSASFILKDSASFMNLRTFNGVSRLCAISESGILHIFDHKLNGTATKPLTPKLNVTIATEKSTKEKVVPNPVPIRCVYSQSEQHLLLAYGETTHALLFEIFAPHEHHSDKNVVLIRQVKRKIGGTGSNEDFAGKTKTAFEGDDVEYLGKGKAGKMRAVPLEQRLDNLTLASTDTTARRDHMAHLLIQGLQSRDRKLLEAVLFPADEALIQATVKHLPIQALVPLLRELIHLFQGKTFTSRIAVRWLQSVIKTHSAILLSSPESVNLMKPLLETIDAKVSGLNALLRLRGRLSLVQEQIENYSKEPDYDVETPILNYQEPDEDENEEPESRSESNVEEWVEFSDLDQSNEDDVNDNDSNDDDEDD